MTDELTDLDLADAVSAGAELEPDDPTYRVIELHAENVMALRAVDITPDSDVVKITGENGQGKTSLGMALWMALGGRTAMKEIDRPVRDGEESGMVRVDLDGLIVTRKFDAVAGTSQVTVTDESGRRVRKPQELLDALTGHMVDPQRFLASKPKEQKELLLGLIDLPFDPAALEFDRAELYETRTKIGRDRDRLRTLINESPEPDGTLPTEPVSVSDLSAEYQAAVDARSEQERRVSQRDTLLATNERLDTRDAEILEQIAALEAELTKNAEQRSDNEALAAALTTDIDAHTPPDIDGIVARIADVEETNRRIGEANEWFANEAQWKQFAESYDDYTAQLAAIDRKKSDAVAAANMPVDGLGFDDDGVTFNGVPLQQASSAEQIRVSLGITMAVSPRIRVVFIRDGSLLDRRSLDIVTEMAAEHGYQVWLELVDSDDPSAVVIHDGEVVN